MVSRTRACRDASAPAGQRIGHHLRGGLNGLSEKKMDQGPGPMDQGPGTNGPGPWDHWTRARDHLIRAQGPRPLDLGPGPGTRDQGPGPRDQQYDIGLLIVGQQYGIEGMYAMGAQAGLSL